MTSHTDTQFQTITHHLKASHNSLKIGQASLGFAGSRLNRQVTVMKKELLSASRNVLRQQKETRDQITYENTNIINTICSRLDNLPLNLAQTHTSARKYSRKIQVYGNNREAILSPLILLQPAFRQLIFTIHSRARELVSAEDLYWLQFEFDNLVNSAKQEAAAMSYGSTATSFDDWIYSQDLASSLPGEGSYGLKPISKERSGHHFEPRATRSEQNGLRKRRNITFQSFIHGLPIGMIEIFIPRLRDVSPNIHNSSEGVEVGFSFLPRFGICSTSIHGRFVKVIDHEPDSYLYTQLNAFNVVQSADCSAYSIFGRGTLEEIDNGIRSGNITPYSVDEHGINPCFAVSIRLQPDTVTVGENFS